MTVQNPNTDKRKQADIEVPLSIDFDAREFFQFVDETGWTDEQKIDYITLAWGIVFDLVMGGATINAPDHVQHACGKLPENPADERLSAHSMVKLSHGQLIEKFTQLTPAKEVPDDNGVDDG